MKYSVKERLMNVVEAYMIII